MVSEGESAYNQQWSNVIQPLGYRGIAQQTDLGRHTSMKSHLGMFSPRKRGTFTQCWFNVGPPSACWPSFKSTLSHTQFVQVVNINLGLFRAGLTQAIPGTSLYSADDLMARCM